MNDAALGLYNVNRCRFYPKKIHSAFTKYLSIVTHSRNWKGSRLRTELSRNLYSWAIKAHEFLICWLKTTLMNDRKSESEYQMPSRVALTCKKREINYNACVKCQRQLSSLIRFALYIFLLRSILNVRNKKQVSGVSVKVPVGVDEPHTTRAVLDTWHW